MSSMTDCLWLIPAAPFAASLIILSLPNPWRRSGAAIAVIGPVAALALSFVAFLQTLQTNGFRAVQNFTWFTFGDNALPLGFVLDPLAAAMLLMITAVGLCIFIFFLRRDARRGYGEQFASALHFLGTGRARFVSAHRVLDRTTQRGCCCKEGVYHHSHWRHGIFSRHVVALQSQRHTSFLRWRQRLPRNRWPGGARPRGHFHRAADLLRRGGKIGTISAARLAARCDGRPHSGKRIDSRSNDGRRRSFSCRPRISAILVRRV